MAREYPAARESKSSRTGICAVSFVIGDVNAIHASLFQPGATLAERIANQFQGAINNTQIASMFYAGLILVVIGLMSSVASRAIASRFDVRRTLGGVL